MTKPIIVVKICYKLLYVIQVVKKIFESNFLASTDIKVFGRTYLFAMLLLIGLALFLHPGCFYLALYTYCSYLPITLGGMVGHSFMLIHSLFSSSTTIPSGHSHP